MLHIICFVFYTIALCFTICALQVTVDVAGQHESYTIVRELEFTSERKRMSVVLREDRTG